MLILPLEFFHDPKFAVPLLSRTAPQLNATPEQRVYDMAGCMGGYGGANMKVYLDKQRLQVSSFKEYVGMYEGMETPVIFERIGKRWEAS